MSAPSPTNSPAPGSPEELEAYLDGRLIGAALAAFEGRLEVEPGLREEVGLQRQIDDVLRRRLAPPARMVIKGLGEMRSGEGAAAGGVRARKGAGGRARWVAAAAAVVVLIGAGAWWGVGLRGRPGPVETLYVQQVAMGLRPQWVCGSDAEMARYLADQFGEGLVVRGEEGRIELVGWTSAPLLSPYTSVLMTRVEGEPVFVLVDRAGSAAPGALSGSAGLHLYKREVAGLVLYEVTPREGPVLLERFELPGE